MSNPGVIKLVRNKYGNHVFWIDDNIGESIHIHLDQFRVDLTVNEFLELANDLESVLNYLFQDKGIDVRTIDSRFLNYQLEQILDISEVAQGRAKLSEMIVFDDLGACRLPDSERVRFLENGMCCMKYKERESNFWSQTNMFRMKEVLSLIRSKGYPFNDEFIMIEKDRHLILDGWHRAACLYYLYGDIEVPVQFVSMNVQSESYKRFLPINELKKDSNLILYGAGQNGKNYKNQIMRFGYNLTVWCDKNANELIEIDGIKIDQPSVIKKRAYDYVVVSVMDHSIQEEIKSELVNNYGVELQKIIFA